MTNLRQVVEKLAAEAVGPEAWWWLSFADPDRPKGEQFLGVAIVRARGLGLAITRCHQLKINPGGQVQGYEIPPDVKIVEGTADRLLSRKELVLARYVEE